MSYGTSTSYPTKKAFRDAVETRNGNVSVFGTSMFGNENATVASELKPSDVVVGPDVYARRNWYANVIQRKDGSWTVK